MSEIAHAIRILAIISSLDMLTLVIGMIGAVCIIRSRP